MNLQNKIVEEINQLLEEKIYELANPNISTEKLFQTEQEINDILYSIIGTHVPIINAVQIKTNNKLLNNCQEFCVV